MAFLLKAKCVELHTGILSRKIKSKKNYKNEIKKILQCINLGKKFGLEIHCGHGMDYKTTKILSKYKGVKEFNIGHFIIGESIFDGCKHTIKKFKKIIKS